MTITDYLNSNDRSLCQIGFQLLKDSETCFDEKKNRLQAAKFWYLEFSKHLKSTTGWYKRCKNSPAIMDFFGNL